MSDSEIESCLKQMKEDEVKAKLKQTTQQAIDLGVRSVRTLIMITGLTDQCKLLTSVKGDLYS